MYDPKTSKPEKLAALALIAMRRAREGHASLVRQFFEISYLWLANGFRPPDYFAGALYRTEIPWREKTEYVGGRVYLRMLQRVNAKRFDYLALNKLFGHALFNAFRIPTPVLHAVIGHDGGQTATGESIDGPCALDDLIRRTGERTLCFKPVEGWGGAGFSKALVTIADGEVRLVVQPDGTEVTVSDFWSNMCAIANGRFMIQSEVRQCRDVARFSPTSLNTTRVWMVQPQRGRWDVYEAVFRMGTNGAIADNVNGLHISARVDVRDGRLFAAVDETVERPIYEVHPTSGVRIEGFSLPMWKEVLGTCRRAAALLPFLKIVGFDVAFGVDGPVVLEFEAVPGDDQIVFGRGVKSLFRSLARSIPQQASEFPKRDDSRYPRRPHSGRHAADYAHR
jgi:hypothetical protein